jgi:hypothetical protein
MPEPNVMKDLTDKFTNAHNKLECFFMAGFFQPSLMFASKDGAYWSEAPTSLG